MTIKELIVKIKEENLTRIQLEDYYEELTSLYGLIQLEMAEKEKAEAMYFLENKKDGEVERADVAIKRMWRGTPQGQRLIELSHYHKAVEKLLSSVKHRIFSQL